MSKLILIAVILAGINISTNLQETQEQIQLNPKVPSDTFKEVTINHDDYTLKISLENANSTQPILVISMDLKNNAKFISPMEEKEFTGKFYFDFGSYEDLALDGQLTETPTSVEKVLYPNNNTNETIKWVTDNTVYKQPLTIKTINDFEVFGRIQFTIEPRCTFEEIPFGIAYKNGNFIFIDPKC